MAKIRTAQTSFITGQLDRASQARFETPVYRNGAAELRNCEPYVAGGVRTRRGTVYKARFNAPAIVRPFEFSLGQAYVAVFRAGVVDFFYASDGTPAGGLTSCPWQASQLRELRFEQLADVMWVVHPAFWPVEIVRTGTASWLLRNFVCDSTRAWPTYRYAPASIRGLSGGGVATSVTLPALPTVSGSPVPLYPGQPGQARLTAGPGPWLPFTVTTVSGLTIGIEWAGQGIAQGVSAQWQFEGADPFGGSYGSGAGASAGGGDIGGGGGADGGADGSGTGADSGAPGDGGGDGGDGGDGGSGDGGGGSGGGGE